MDIIDYVGTDQKQTTTTTHMTLETIGASDPWMLFLYALKAPSTREKYIQRLTKFLDFLGYTEAQRKKKLELLQPKQEQILFMHSTRF